MGVGEIFIVSAVVTVILLLLWAGLIHAFSVKIDVTVGDEDTQHAPTPLIERSKESPLDAKKTVTTPPPLPAITTQVEEPVQPKRKLLTEADVYGSAVPSWETVKYLSSLDSETFFIVFKYFLSVNITHVQVLKALEKFEDILKSDFSDYQGKDRADLFAYIVAAKKPYHDANSYTIDIYCLDQACLYALHKPVFSDTALVDGALVSSIISDMRHNRSKRDIHKTMLVSILHLLCNQKDFVKLEVNYLTELEELLGIEDEVGPVKSYILPSKPLNHAGFTTYLANISK